MYDANYDTKSTLLLQSANANGKHETDDPVVGRLICILVQHIFTITVC